MKTRTPLSLAPLIALAIAAPVSAQSNDTFRPGPRIEDFGPIAAVEQTQPIAEGESFRHSFDVAARAEDGELNRGFVSVARFLNMLANAGATDEQVAAAIVVHGGGSRDVTKEAGDENQALVATLLAEGVRIELCGQSAAAHGIKTEDLLPGVHMALSAMTAHARLQREGYTLNPF